MQASFMNSEGLFIPVPSVGDIKIEHFLYKKEKSTVASPQRNRLGGPPRQTSAPLAARSRANLSSERQRVYFDFQPADHIQPESHRNTLVSLV